MYAVFCAVWDAGMASIFTPNAGTAPEWRRDNYQRIRESLPTIIGPYGYMNLRTRSGNGREA